MIEDKPQVESDVFSTLKRIDEEISRLYKLLDPIINQIPERAGEVDNSTKLSNELHRI